jgi:hypothetical protein
MRLADRVGKITDIQKALVPLRKAAKVAEGRDKLPTRRKVETHEKAILILRDRRVSSKK